MRLRARRIAAVVLMLAALSAALAWRRHSVAPPRVHVYYCWNPALEIALPCRYVKAERDV